MSLLPSHSDLLYTLKFDFGQPAELLKPVAGVTNYQTGALTRGYDRWKIRRVIMLPEKSNRTFIRDLAYLSSSRKFTEGGLFEQDLRDAIIDINDLPNGFIIELDDLLYFGKETYLIKTSQKSEKVGGWLLKLKHVSNMNNDPYSIETL